MNTTLLLVSVYRCTTHGVVHVTRGSNLSWWQRQGLHSDNQIMLLQSVAIVMIQDCSLNQM
jgi:hypothetical protein